MEEDSGRAFFRTIVEYLGDSFEPRLCDTYVRLFARVIEVVHPAMRATHTVQRYERIRRPHTCDRDPARVYVLSRVTLGADVAVTSIIFDAAKRRFPNAEIHLVGPRKNWELFANDPRIHHHPFVYPRAGSMRERLSTWPTFDDPNCIVIDPDSRLSQLGLLPVSPEANYFFFESRAYGGDADATLVQLTRQWLREVFEIENARAYIAPRPGPVTAKIAVSLGVGDNPEKRLAGAFEEELLKMLAGTGKRVLIDQGAGEEETNRVQQLCARVPGVESWNGAYAPFAHAIANAQLYIGYDSAGQHVAAACGTPLISIFAGYTSERMFQRWRPDGAGRIQVIKVSAGDAPEAILAEIRQNLTL